jgi:hypothetical protein
MINLVSFRVRIWSFNPLSYILPTRDLEFKLCFGSYLWYRSNGELMDRPVGLVVVEMH